MSDYRVISSDNHVIEPPDLWLTRIDPGYRDQAPRLLPDPDGGDGMKWVCAEITQQGPEQGANVGKRFDDPESITVGDVYENVRAGGHDPDEAVKDLDIDGVDVGIVYPTVGFGHFRIGDSGLRSAIFRAYNDYLAEFCGAHPKRLGGIAMLNIDPVEDAIEELKRSRKMGLVAAMISSYAPLYRTYDSPEYDPLWATAQDMGVPLSLHAATNSVGSAEGNGRDKLSVATGHARVANMDHYARVSISTMIYGGVFQRFPRLQIGAVEFELAWIPHFLDRIDFNYNQRGPGRSERFDDDMMPSDFFRRNCFAGFQEDSMGIRDRHAIGVDNLLWGSDYPHTESTWPRSREIIEDILADCTDEEKAKIAGGNSARIYGM